jgi:hypothetical protein
MVCSCLRDKRQGPAWARERAYDLPGPGVGLCEGHSLTISLWPEEYMVKLEAAIKTPKANRSAEERKLLKEAQTSKFEPRLFYFPPSSLVPGREGAILIIPGGGLYDYTVSEGHSTAAYLSSIGFSCYVLLYRFVHCLKDRYVSEAVPVSAFEDIGFDAVTALACVRKREPKKHVHVLGFSAGGMIACGMCGFSRLPESARPDSASCIYGSLPIPELAAGMVVAAGSTMPTHTPETDFKSCPPMFVYSTKGDQVFAKRQRDAGTPEGGIEWDREHRMLVEELEQGRIRPRVVLWPNVWNDEFKMGQLVLYYQPFAFHMQHGQGFGFWMKDLEKHDGSFRTFAWVQEWEEWLAGVIQNRATESSV